MVSIINWTSAKSPKVLPLSQLCPLAYLEGGQADSFQHIKAKGNTQGILEDPGPPGGKTQPQLSAHSKDQRRISKGFVTLTFTLSNRKSTEYTTGTYWSSFLKTPHTRLTAMQNPARSSIRTCGRLCKYGRLLSGTLKAKKVPSRGLRSLAKL